MSAFKVTAISKRNTPKDVCEHGSRQTLNACRRKGWFDVVKTDYRGRRHRSCYCRQHAEKTAQRPLSPEELNS